MDATFVAAGLGVVLVLALLILKWRFTKMTSNLEDIIPQEQEPVLQTPKESVELLLPTTMQLVHQLSSYDVVKGFGLEEKESLDAHLDILTSQLAEKESSVRLSKHRIRETENEIQNLNDNKMHLRYRDIMDALRTELMNNERDCRHLQDQIEWVSHRRAELKEEVRIGHKLYGDAAADLTNNLAELQKGRAPVATPYIPPGSMRFRKCNASPAVSFIIKPSHENMALREGFFHDPL